jgi:hypothetical protein
MTPLLALGAFIVGVTVVVLATERLVEGLVDVATVLRVAPFVASVILSWHGVESAVSRARCWSDSVWSMLGSRCCASES